MVREGITRTGEESVSQLLERLGLKLTRYIKEELTRNGTVSSGVLRDSYTSNVEGSERVIVGSPLEYAKHVEWGTGPRNSVPPYSAIEPWVKRELKPSPEELESVTWSVMNKIKKEGTSPQPHVRPAVDRLKREVGSVEDLR